MTDDEWKRKIRTLGVIYILSGGRTDVDVSLKSISKYIARWRIMEMDEAQWAEHFRARRLH
jgi:hypothetical protein